ncbi:hypothetical protein GCM10007874_15560 [Labrys miyagiensis]|uniref:Uncharacterized protein n=1 Tax=Labrys miyagiensis TaxID=346912 RepID=A0ABQ6CIJ6_9HYPH|nr:hypothetical protein GCM10007874_15560 [Labrys miyagiensis]
MVADTVGTPTTGGAVSLMMAMDMSRVGPLIIMKTIHVTTTAGIVDGISIMGKIIAVGVVTMGMTEAKFARRVTG